MIQVNGAKKWIQNGARRVEILQGISLDIPAGQFVAIVGASGSGEKSTLLGLLAGLDSYPAKARYGWTECQSTTWRRPSWRRCAGARLVLSFLKSYQLIQTLTALENVLLLPYEAEPRKATARRRRAVCSMKLA